MRLDKWLWAARFFKTRSVAAQAVSGGKVHLNGARTKPGKPVRPGDQVSVRRDPYEWTVVVRGLEKHRGPASEADLLYEETAESRQAREGVTAALRAEGPRYPASKGRPSKKARRDILRFTRDQG